AWAARSHEAGVPERAGAYLAVSMPGADGSSTLHAAPLPSALVERAERIAEGRAFLNVLQTERGRVQRGFFLPFILAYASLAIVAIVTGSVLAGRLARPLEALAASAERTSLGSTDTEVARTDKGEVGDLQTAFNRMIRRLAAQKDELSRLERMAAWREIAQSLAHEIKNPLTPIQLAVQELRDRYPGSDDRYGALLSDCGEIVDEEVASLRRLVREFSEFARLPEPVRKPGDPADLLHELGKLYGERVTVAAREGRVVWFDREEMKRALINLVDNGLAACESAGREPVVNLNATEEGGMLVIAVEDHGTGLSDDKRAKIFEPHFTTKTDGMGLGLPIVQGIVYGHGGTIEVESEEGVGTTFRLLLPTGEETG
ncbi:MAG: HAMP domain-containing protein, partial [Gemmatimonadetes bacterium]|nr:HAMP domain-containing protein [Gemmatimonadota bacterium]